MFRLKLHIFQVMSKEDTTQKTYVYELAIPITPRWVSLVAGPLEVLPDQTNFLISNLCLPHDLSRLRNTMEFFHEAYRSVDLHPGDLLTEPNIFSHSTGRSTSAAIMKII